MYWADSLTVLFPSIATIAFSSASTSVPLNIFSIITLYGSYFNSFGIDSVQLFLYRIYTFNYGSRRLFLGCTR
jgi:hypothetical protein